MGTPLSSKYDGVPENIRFLVISKQMVFYKVTESGIEIIRVLDGRTDYLVHLFGSNVSVVCRGRHSNRVS